MISDCLKTLLFFSIILSESIFLPAIQGSEKKVNHQRNRSKSAPSLYSAIVQQSSFLTAPLTNEIKVCNFMFSEQLDNYEIVEEILKEISEKPSSIFLLQNLKSPKDFQDPLTEKGTQNIVLLTEAPLKKAAPSSIPEFFFNGLLYNTMQFKVEDMPPKYYTYPGKNEGIGLFCVNGHPQKYRMMAKLFTHIPTEHKIAIFNMDLQPSPEDDTSKLTSTIKATIQTIQKESETTSIIFGGHFNRLPKRMIEARLYYTPASQSSTPPTNTKNLPNYSQTALLKINNFMKHLIKQKISPRISSVVNKLLEEGKISEEELWQLAQTDDSLQSIKLADIQSLKERHED